MASNAGRFTTLAPPLPRIAALALNAVVAGGIVLLLSLSALHLLDVAPGAAFWARAGLTAASVLGVVATAISLAGATGRTRRVRIWLCVAFAFWLTGELVRDVEYIGGVPSVPGVADLTLLGVLLCAALAYVATSRGRLRRNEEVALYLDALIVFFATAALMLTVFGPAALASTHGAINLAYAIFFVATTGATLLLDLAVRAERRWRGPYVLLCGIAILGLGYLWRVAAPAADGLADTGLPAQALVAGMVLVMLGTVTWTDAEEQDEGYLRLAARLRSALPLGALALTPALLVIQVASGLNGTLGVLNIVSISFVLGSVAIRQSVALLDRESAIARERDLARELSTAEQRYRALVEQQPGVVYVAEPGPEGRWHYVSPHVEQMLGFPVSAWLDDSTLWARQIHPADRERVLGEEGVPAALRPRGSKTWEYRLRAADGRYVWVMDDERVAQSDDQGRPTLVQGVLLDITERKLAEEALRVSEQQTRTIIETASYAFIGMDGTGQIIDWNQRAVDIFGWQRDEAIGRSVAELIVPAAQRQAHVEGLRRYLATGEGPILSKRMEITALHRDGTEFPIEITVWPLHSNGVVRFNALVDDITVRKVLEQQLRHQALHDSLTGLANRTLFVDRIQHALERIRRRPEESVAVLFLDFDDFKTVNDSLGHAKGDVLLKAIAARLSAAVRGEDTAARLGGDEFGILIESQGVDPQTTARRVLDALAEPFEIEGTAVSMQASIGIAVSGTHGQTPEELVRNADLAMYLAKRRGKNRYEFYEAGMHEQALRRLELKRRLEQAIAGERLEVNYQPIVDLQDGSIVGLEALLRWRGRDGQFVPLSEVVPLAEETGLIIPIGRFVLQQACRSVRRWQEQFGLHDLYAAVNLSVVQLDHETLLEDIQGALAGSGLRPASLVVEITESAFSADSLSTVRTIRALRASGIRLALDDFGTGYSSLARLGHFPVDIVKIDRGFVRQIGRDREGALVQSVIDLGRRMGMEVIAEGIETRAQLVALQARGAERGQGHYFARALPAEQIGSVLSAGRLPRSRRRGQLALGA